jgi:hypothetical protein
MKETLNRTMRLSPRNIMSQQRFSIPYVIERNEVTKQSLDEIVWLSSLTLNM